MNEKVSEYLKTQRIGVLSVKMPDGTPHGATLHFATLEDKMLFVFQTSPDYKKVDSFRNNPTSASFVIGTSEEEMKTLQMDGEVKMSSEEEVGAIYYVKFPEKSGKYPGNIFFTFTPNWWRYTDYKNPGGKLTLSSTDA